ncbi:PREDICTED: glutamate-gated chloride channel-like [Rhagoletis zephyria]|uniref:glutamate-gated chloride channel-like n=1 Tax=Rhagoletis zephyria TaxID=28612 RepID=UPI00081193F6|nr:PREDICTED: glutamate-gated chloride channel-like [Rhagoletis zephyria]
MTLIKKILFCSGQGQKRFRDATKKILDDLLSSYDKRIRPNSANETAGKPVKIQVNMLLRNIEKIDDVAHEWSVQLTFRQKWTDDRLKFNDYNGQISYINLVDGANQIWKPDTFFKNEKKGHFHNILTPNQLVRIYPDGAVLYSTRISLVLACPMDLKYYPADKQVCQIQLASYGYTTEDVDYQWKEKDPVQVTKDINLPRFTLTEFTPSYCTSKTNTGEYSCLKAAFTVKREINYYLMQMYIPCLMLVLVSWIGFWMDIKKDLTARTIIVLGSLLTMACLVTYKNSSMPSVSYTKRIDVWTGVSLTFVFAALLEMATVNYLAKQENISSESRQYKMVQVDK